MLPGAVEVIQPVENRSGGWLGKFYNQVAELYGSVQSIVWLCSVFYNQVVELFGSVP